RPARAARARTGLACAALLARTSARARARRGERRETRARTGGAGLVGCARAGGVVSFKELETAGWSEAGRADAYDRVVGRVTARAIEPLLDAARARTGTRLLDVATGPGHVAGAAAARGAVA